jgi:hypothetical protein
MLSTWDFERCDLHVPQKMAPTTDSSPFQSSPAESAASPRLFWQNRNTFNSENTYGTRSGSPSPTRRSSIERLQRASRVKNSNILALEQRQEYDPTRILQVERPLAKVQGNAYAGTGLPRPENRSLGHHRNESKTNLPLYNPAKPSLPPPTASSSKPPSPTKEPPSPIKSSLSTSRFKSSFDPETGVWSADTSCDERELPDGMLLQRHAKSVTFDAAPPQVNEYEMATPDLSSIGSNSREGSYDSEEDDDDDDHYLMHDGEEQDESFDASLEDTDKTPVVGPDDWRHDSRSEEPFDRSPMPEDMPTATRPQHQRTDSSNSNGDHRPLPPLPGAMQLTQSHSNASNGLSASADRMLGAHRSLPSPPAASATKAEIQNIGTGKMTLEERLKLMMLSDDGKSAAEQQRERRMRRAGARDRHESHTPEREVQTPEVQSPSVVSADYDDDEEDDTVGDLSGLGEYQLPQRISRESILRRVNGNKAFERESDYNFSSPAPSSSPERPSQYDPEVPIPSIEEDDEDTEDCDDTGSIIVKPDSEDKDADLYDMPDLYNNADAIGREAMAAKEQEQEETEDSESQYSDNSLEKSKAVDLDTDLEMEAEDQEDQIATPRGTTPVEEPPSKDSRHAFNPPPLGLEPTTKQLDFSRGFDSYMLSPETESAATEPEAVNMTEAQAYLQRPRTPEQQLTKSLSKPEYDGSGWGDPEEDFAEPSTPDSVIHHPVSDYEDEGEEDDELEQEEEEEEEAQARLSPTVPEQIATIKSASGSKLKTRPSATPSDLAAMREARRHVSREVPNVPPIPERHHNRLSRDMGNEVGLQPPADDFLERHPSFKKRSLILDLDLGLSLDQDFARVIEAQKVGFHQITPPSPKINHTSFSPARQASGAGEMRAAATQMTNVIPAKTTTTSASTSTNIDANIPCNKQRGYLMRQNTKLVAASDKETEDFRACRSAGNSPVKQNRPQSWTVEPWNGQARKRSVRKRPGVNLNGPVPPLPGQESNATAALNPLTEEDLSAEMATEESGERGRLFIKVMGVKDLDLPLPKSKLAHLRQTLPRGIPDPNRETCNVADMPPQMNGHGSA